ncbi:BRCA1-A complex subunit RAP80 [Etheostoma cragini]|uniref:BRCA1-A complex subunit RAP80 n=1 Tax=Etheostoma cragini TaxID=417921 RepID=UPI00155ECB52|nr:BRCA1-A complex subunit RAP80 [Etheostoma cragini]
MALRKQMLKDDVPSGSRQIADNTPEDEALDDRDHNDFLPSLQSSSSNQKRKRENKSKPKEMSEEEMMDWALRLSQQEASAAAVRRQQEEDAMMKALRESLVSQTQPVPPPQSPNLPPDAGASLGLGSRRKLVYSNGRTGSAIDQGPSEDVCPPETALNRRAEGTGDGSKNGSKKRRRKEGSPLLEMPDSQASPCRSDWISGPLDSPLSSDSTQIEDCQLQKSPVFPSAGYRAQVHVPRLSQNLLDTYRTSGFVLCSQDTCTSTGKSPPAQPESPKGSSGLPRSRSPVFSETDQGEDEDTEPDPEYFMSPVFGRSTQHKTSPSACKPRVSVCNSGFTCSSQESLTSSVRPKSPVFPRSPGFPRNPVPPETSATCESPVFPEADGGQAEQSHGCCTSPVFGATGRGPTGPPDELKPSVSPSGPELTGSDSDGDSTITRDPSQSLAQGGETDHNPDGRFKKASDNAEEELNDVSKDSGGTELTSDMVLRWSDEDQDVTPVGSPSPVFPEERPVPQAESRAASLNQDWTASSPEMTCRPSTSSTCTGRRQPPTTEREPQPISSQGAVGGATAPPREPAGGPTVHYYWGVPFCPRGLDPDQYTQVILAQMEVYEKSLKQAQRGLLRKAEWGEAVLPQPEKSPSPESPAESPQQFVPRRRGLRLRGKDPCEAADSPPAEAKDDEEDKEQEEEEGIQSKEEEKNEEREEEGQDMDDCEVCPETQLSDDDRTQDLMMATDAGAESDLKMSPEPPDVEMILQKDPPEEQELQPEEEMEVDAPVDSKTKGNVPVSGSNVRREEVEEDGEDPDVEEIDHRELKRSTSPELEPAGVPQSPQTEVDCPICQGSFPATEIERHAAFCDGEVAVVDERRPAKNCSQVSLKSLRKRTRRPDPTAEETNDPSNTCISHEKCFICQKAVPLKDYSRHTEFCLQRQRSKTAAKGKLLSALDQTESRASEARPSGSKLQPGEIIDLRDDDDDDEEEDEEAGVSTLLISNSPIRSFTPISEASDCLIDFKRPHRAKTPRQRRRR